MSDKTKLAIQRLLLTLGVMIGILLLTAVYFYGNIVAIFLIIPHFLNHMEGFGFGPYYSWVVLLPVSFYLYYAVRQFMSFRKEKRNIGLYMIAGFVIVWCLAMAFVTKDHLFDSQTGKPLYSFFYTPNGSVKLQDSHHKYNPKTGKLIKPITPQVVEQMEILENGIPNVKHLRVNKDSQFFRIDGSPLLYYWESTDGKIEFFAQNGSHPQNGEKLLPVSKTIVDKFFNYIETNRTEMIVGYGKEMGVKTVNKAIESDYGFSPESSSTTPQNTSPSQPSSGLRALSDVYKNL